jgi:methylmalonyl-CoA carboxyltransferase large subunit
LETQVTELRKIALAPSGMATASVLAQPAEATSPMVGKVTTGEKPEKREAEEITPDTLVVLSAAVTAFLGKRVRIRSAKMLQSPYEIVNPWSQQGRVVVQASHNLRSRN